MDNVGTIVTMGGVTTVQNPGSLSAFVDANGPTNIELVSVHDIGDTDSKVQDTVACLGKVSGTESSIYLAGTFQITPGTEKPQPKEVWTLSPATVPEGSPHAYTFPMGVKTAVETTGTNAAEVQAADKPVETTTPPENTGTEGIQAGA